MLILFSIKLILKKCIYNKVIALFLIIWMSFHFRCAIFLNFMYFATKHLIDFFVN